MGGLVVRRLGEPPGERTEVRRAIRPPRAPLVEQAYGVDELLDRGHGRLPQQPGLRRVPRVPRREPVVQTAPPVPPRVERLFFRLGQRFGGIRALGHRVGRLPSRGEFQQPLVADGFQVAQQHRDLGAGVGQVRDEPVDVVDQPFLVREEAVDVPVGEVHRAPQRGHERLRVVSQGGEPLRHGQQEQMDLGRVGIVARGEYSQRAEPVGDVGQGHRLELAAPPDGLLVERDRLLGGLPGCGELIQGTLAVEVLHRGDAAGVDVRAQVPPRHELLQGLGQLLVSVDQELGRHVFRPQVHDVALLRPREGTQQAPVKVGVRDAQVHERLWLAMATRRLRGSANHHYILPHAYRQNERNSPPMGVRRICR